VVIEPKYCDGDAGDVFNICVFSRGGVLISSLTGHFSATPEALRGHRRGCKGAVCAPFLGQPPWVKGHFVTRVSPLKGRWRLRRPRGLAGRSEINDDGCGSIVGALERDGCMDSGQMTEDNCGIDARGGGWRVGGCLWMRRPGGG